MYADYSGSEHYFILKYVVSVDLRVKLSKADNAGRVYRATIEIANPEKGIIWLYSEE